MESFNDYILDIGQLHRNVNNIKSIIGCDVKFCAVVKADAYGVGMREVAEVICDHIDAFAVANIDEGIRLRSVSQDKKIIVLGVINLEQINACQYYFLSPTVSTVLEMEKLSRGVKNPLSVEFGLDTGMGRVGFSKKNEIFDAISLIKENSNLSISGVYSHLATKQNNVEFMIKQRCRFEQLLEPFDGMNITRHISNSSAAWYDDNFNYDMVRVGFGLYGMGEDYDGLKRAIEIVSRVVKINYVNAGDPVGYDCSFVAQRDSVIAVLPVGYYDGVSRRLSNRGRVLINGQTAQIVGRICMDMMMVDVTDINNVEVGSRVVIIGCDGDEEITIKEHADIVGTSEYEILSRFNNSRMNKIIK